MPSWLPSIAYPPPSQPGFWGPVTSTLNWCEEDYYATHYAAEIVNTLTNVMFMILGAKGINSCLKNGHDTIFLITFVGYLIVGTGSSLFHATLKYPMQLVDELSMIYTTCFMCYATFSFARTRTFNILLGTFLVSLAIFITLYYHYLQDPAFHQNAYAILTAIVLLRSMFVMESTLRPSLRRKEAEYRRVLEAGNLTADEQAAVRSEISRNRTILTIMWRMVATGLSVFLGGFAIWHLDNNFCPTLCRWRRQIGLPWGILLEGHGWWHLMTGVGAYYYIVWGIWLRHCLNERYQEYEVVWPHFWSIADVVKTSKANSGAVNRAAEKKIS